LQLYLGIDPHLYPSAIHYPVIRTTPLVTQIPSFDQFTHSIFTSRRAVDYWFLSHEGYITPVVLAIGRSTANQLKQYGVDAIAPLIETQEGLVHLLKTIDLEGAHIFYPHAKIHRPILKEFFISKNIRYFACPLYETHFQQLEPLPDLALIDEIIFTSPSTVEGFLRIFKQLPKGKRLTCIGPVTQQALDRIVFFNVSHEEGAIQ
jgi:uroporphyrinogen-III synthase